MESIYERAIETWGGEAQMDMIIEECSELIVALQRLKRGRGRVELVQDEVADVLIMAEQAKVLFGADDIERIVARKLARLETRVALSYSPR